MVKAVGSDVEVSAKQHEEMSFGERFSVEMVPLTLVGSSIDTVRRVAEQSIETESGASAEIDEVKQIMDRISELQEIAEMGSLTGSERLELKGALEALDVLKGEMDAQTYESAKVFLTKMLEDSPTREQLIARLQVLLNQLTGRIAELSQHEAEMLGKISDKNIKVADQKLKDAEKALADYLEAKRKASSGFFGFVKKALPVAMTVMTICLAGATGGLGGAAAMGVILAAQSSEIGGGESLLSRSTGGNEIAQGVIVGASLVAVAGMSSGMGLVGAAVAIQMAEQSGMMDKITGGNKWIAFGIRTGIILAVAGRTCKMTSGNAMILAGRIGSDAYSTGMSSKGGMSAFIASWFSKVLSSEDQDTLAAVLGGIGGALTTIGMMAAMSGAELKDGGGETQKGDAMRRALMAISLSTTVMKSTHEISSGVSLLEQSELQGKMAEPQARLVLLRWQRKLVQEILRALQSEAGEEVQRVGAGTASLIRSWAQTERALASPLS